MMKYLRNPEISRSLLIFFIISAVASVFAFLWNISFGIFTVLLCTVLILIYAVATFRRYKRITEMAYDINKILHGDEQLSLNKYSEGELEILQSEVYKMTVRLREQKLALTDDKIYLANSIADISHQIRTPLTSINLIMTFLSEPELSMERREQLVHELQALLARIDWLINALLKLSKLDAGSVRFKKETILHDTLVHKACAPLLVPIELREQQLIIRTDGSVFADILWTCEALGNIIKNCMEHTPIGGRLEITATENPLYSEIVVSDNGSGISKEDLPHIFERFYKGVNSAENNIGIGLALARVIVSGQSGTIKAENKASGGAKFTIRFYKGAV